MNSASTQFADFCVLWFVVSLQGPHVSGPGPPLACPHLWHCRGVQEAGQSRFAPLRFLGSRLVRVCLLLQKCMFCSKKNEGVYKQCDEKSCHAAFHGTLLTQLFRSSAHIIVFAAQFLAGCAIECDMRSGTASVS
jgi:hypothetical protein